MSDVFEPLRWELATWQEAEDAPVQLWWRDDDACIGTPALTTLLEITQDLPLALAVIPACVSADFPAWLQTRDPGERVSILPHGWTHESRTRLPDKKAELDQTFSQDEARRALITLQNLFAARVVPVMTPPWNRVHPDVLPALAAAGYVAVSSYGAALTDQTFPVVNTHVDLLDWSRRTSVDHVPMVAPDQCVAVLCQALTRARLGKQSQNVCRTPGQPPTDLSSRGQLVGLLTHHLVQDQQTWHFLSDLREVLAQWECVAWVSIADVATVGDAVDP